jgi:cell division protein FtsW (lipid II flippase)
MVITRRTIADRAEKRDRLTSGRHEGRGVERVLLIVTSIVIVSALALTARARLSRVSDVQPVPLNLSTVDRREQLLPYLQTIASAAERQYTASKIFLHLPTNGEAMSHVGEIGQIRVPIREVLSTRGLSELHARARLTLSSHPEATTIPLLTAGDVARLKPLWAVRDAGGFTRQLVLWSAAFFCCFFGVHVYWSLRATEGPQYLLPAVQLLSGIGMTLMVTLRDPLRDTLTFVNFAEGAAAGCIVLAAAATLDFRRLAGKLSYVFLLAAFVVSSALVLFGSGPAGSDAKVNLLGFQPAEVIRILIVFFLAGYFAERWEFLRTLREEGGRSAKFSRWIEVPRREYFLPVFAGVVVSLGFFFLQKDLGPALLIACLFLGMYAVARNRSLFALAGFAVILAGFASGYYLQFPKNVAGRISMWLSPWDNSVRGGEQVAHSLWGFASGGTFGSGLGLGDPQNMPAAHTDLILAALGEEWGFVGVLCVLAIYSGLVWFGIRTALRSRSDYNFFLALGLTLALALQVALIAGGVLDLIPLSGVVVPFLSYGRTALITNFAIIGILISLAASGSADEATTQPFRASTRGLAYLLTGIGAILLVKAAYVQVVRADVTAGAGALALQADGQRRYEYNPRLLSIAHAIPRGTIYDRNGLPLATSEWNELAKSRDAYASMGVTIAAAAEPGATRFYPLGPQAFHLLGDLRTHANWSATNSSLAERDFGTTLQGFDDRATVVETSDRHAATKTYGIRYDYRELLPLLRHRWQPNSPQVRKLLDRDRNLHMSIDARLQMRASELLEAQLTKLGRSRGAVVIMEPTTGDVLASVSYPWPSQTPVPLNPASSDDSLLDRARYGLYPPGSSFKIVTSIAALRKDPSTAESRFECKRLPDGRTGNFIRGSRRPIHDDIRDTEPHGNIALRTGLVVSCNAFFAQLGTYVVGAEALLDTASHLGISVANPANAQTLRRELAQASYGQGQVVASPFQMARVAATIAQKGSMPFGRWITDSNNPRLQPPQSILGPQQSTLIGDYMRDAVTSGTGRSAQLADLPIAGKTGTAELEHAPSHAWFVGFAPYGGVRKLAFAVLIENGDYGGTAAAPLAAELMKEAKTMGYFEKQQ